MGPLFLLLTFLCLVTVSGCASLPNVQKMMGHELSSSDQPTKIMGPKGELSAKTSKAMIKRLEGQVDETKLLEQQVQLMQSVSGSPLVAGNKVTLLIDGEATYAAMFEAIQNAKDHINFETFIFEDDEVGKRFSDLLIRKSAEGVQVNLIYDSFGSMNTPVSFFQRLRDGGVLVLEFNPVNPWKVLVGKKWALRHRDHRKILVVDGAIAFTGGVNISGVYSGSSASRSRSGEEGRTLARYTRSNRGSGSITTPMAFHENLGKAKGTGTSRQGLFPLCEASWKHAGQGGRQFTG